MRIPIAMLVAAILCAGTAAHAQTTASDAAQPGPSDQVKAQTPLGRIEILSDTEGVDFKPYLQQWHRITQTAWQPLIPKEVNSPALKSGKVAIRFRILLDGQVQEGTMVLEERSGDTALDRAAWGALTGSNYPPLPRDFHGPYLELRAYFLYNMEVPK